MLTTAKTTARPRGQARTERKRRAIVDAAIEVFLAKGYFGASMEEIATRSDVSKETVYKRFASKEALFSEIAADVTEGVTDTFHNELLTMEDAENLEEHLLDYAYRQLTLSLTPRLIDVRRLIIGELGRFPELGETLYRNGPQQAIARLAATFEDLANKGLLSIDDPTVAASHFNWLVMAEPLTRSLLMGNATIPSPQQLRRHATNGVRVFLAAYGRR